jgi:hypothetical protein
MSSPDVQDGARPEVPSRSMNMVRSTKYSAESPYNDSPGTSPAPRAPPRRTEPLTPASRAPTGTGRTGMFAIPPNNYDFYTEEEKYVLPRRGDETLPDLSSWLRTTQTRAHDVSRTRNQHAFPLLGRFLFFSPLSPERATKGSPDRLLPVRPIYVSFF